MKPDERAFLNAIKQKAGGDAVLDVIERTGIPRKRAEYLLDKWTRKGWYSWGVVIDRGWLTDAGLAAEGS